MRGILSTWLATSHSAALPRSYPFNVQMGDPKIPLLAAAATLATVALTVLSVRPTKDASRYRRLEQPDTTLPLVGNLVDAVRHAEDLHDWTLENTIRFEGRPWKFTVPGRGETIVVTTPDALEEILSTKFTSFIKGKLLDEVLSDIAANTLATVDGERWYHQLKTVVKFFSARVLDMFVRQSIQKNIGRTHSLMEDAIKSWDRSQEYRRGKQACTS